MIVDYDGSSESLCRLLVDDLNQLVAMPLTPDQAQIALSAQDRAQALLNILAPRSGLPIDPITFDQLMQIAGPETVPDLLNQVLSDLLDIRTALDMAIPKLDWTQIRQQSHILISVAGSLGADSLLRRAEELNRHAHSKDGQALDALTPIVRDEIAALMQFVRSHAQNLPG